MPWRIRWRSAYGLMSTSSTSSAAARTSSGIRSLTGAPVIVATASATESRCWMLQVLTTSIPASSMTLTSSQRLVRADPGALVWASSSTRATAGCRARIGVGVHLLDDDAAVLDPPARHDLEAVEQLRRLGPTVRLDEARRRGRSREPCDDAPPRASGRSCRRPAPSRGRREVGRGRSRPPPPILASISSADGRPSVVALRVAHGSCLIAPEAVQVQVQHQHVDPRLAEEAEERCFSVTRDRGADVRFGHAARLGDPRDLVLRARLG